MSQHVLSGTHFKYLSSDFRRVNNGRTVLPFRWPNFRFDSPRIESPRLSKEVSDSAAIYKLTNRRFLYLVTYFFLFLNIFKNFHL